MRKIVREYIKAGDGQFVEIGGKNGHVTSVRKIFRQRHGGKRTYGWIHSHSCMFCRMKHEYLSKSPCPVKHNITKSTEDLMGLHQTPELTMGGMLESWS